MPEEGRRDANQRSIREFALPPLNGLGTVVRVVDWYKSLDLTLTARVCSFTTTSWKPALISPPVMCSNCFPAWTRRLVPSGILTGIRFPVLRAQMLSPGYRERPCMVRKFKSEWKPAKMVSFFPYLTKSDEVGARRCGLARLMSC